MSYKYKFKGKIYPQRVNFSLGQTIPLKLEMEEFDIDGVVKIYFQDSRFAATFESENKYTGTSNLETLRNYVEEAVRVLVDIYCFINSYNYDVLIDRVECSDLDIDYTFTVRGEWNIDKDPETVNQEFTYMLKHVFINKDYAFIRDVLADFRRGIKYPKMTAPHCYRAIETIRKFCFEDDSVKDDDKRRKKGWKKMRKELNLNRSDFDEIEEFALPGRHGEYPAIEYEERESIMNFTREVINKTIEKIKNET